MLLSAESARVRQFRGLFADSRGGSGDLTQAGTPASCGPWPSQDGAALIARGQTIDGVDIVVLRDAVRRIGGFVFSHAGFQLLVADAVDEWTALFELLERHGLIAENQRAQGRLAELLYGQWDSMTWLPVTPGARSGGATQCPVEVR